MRTKLLAALLSLSALVSVCVGTASAAEVTAAPTNDSLLCDGVPQTPTVYKINGSNYFKIRDLAAILNGTPKQFSVGYDTAENAVTANSGAGYTKLATDLTGAPAGGAKSAEPSNDSILINGEPCWAEVYKIDGMNYFKLRDLGKALDFFVGWDNSTKTVALDTSKGYYAFAADPNVADASLFELAGEYMERFYNLPIAIANGYPAECDYNDKITADPGDGYLTEYCRVTGYTTIAQVEAAANELWYQTNSRRGSGIDGQSLNIMRSQFIERNGVLYQRLDGGVGGGGGVPVLKQMLSRTADEAVFAAYLDWGNEDDSIQNAFQFSLVFEDGTWKYLES